MHEDDPTTKKKAASGTEKIVDGEQEREKGSTSQLVTDKMIKILVLLEEKTHMMGNRMEQIKAKVNELIDSKNGDSLTSVNGTRSAAGPRTHRCSLGRVMLALGILGLVVPASPTELGSSGQGEEASMAMKALIKRGWSWPENMSPPYEGLQAMLEGVAQGIEEKQAELEEVARSIESRQNELEKVEKNIEEKRALLIKATREVKDEKIRRAEGSKRLTMPVSMDEVADGDLEEPVQRDCVGEKK
jgi:hypothetical protein